MSTDPTLKPTLLGFYTLEAAAGLARAAWLEPGDTRIAAAVTTTYRQLGIDYALLVSQTGAAHGIPESHARAVVADRTRNIAEDMWLALGSPELAGMSAAVEAAEALTPLIDTAPDAIPAWMMGGGLDAIGGP